MVYAKKGVTDGEVLAFGGVEIQLLAFGPTGVDAK